MVVLHPFQAILYVYRAVDLEKAAGVKSKKP